MSDSSERNRPALSGGFPGRRLRGRFGGSGVSVAVDGGGRRPGGTRALRELAFGRFFEDIGPFDAVLVSTLRQFVPQTFQEDATGRRRRAERYGIALPRTCHTGRPSEPTAVRLSIAPAFHASMRYGRHVGGWNQAAVALSYRRGNTAGSRGES
jgi:hypothetical protein